jgi:rubrerythrin
MYTCPECGYASAENGKCPTCDVPMIMTEENGSEEEVEEEEL